MPLKPPPDNSLLIADRVIKIYKWLDARVDTENSSLCRACGNCCNFKTFGHRLYVTTPEMLYFTQAIHANDLKPMFAGRCPYNIDDKCSVYQYRFAGCRIFCCRGNNDLQSVLSEDVIQKFKKICTDLHLPYRYIELSVALNELANQKPSTG